jgi:endonuclease YncB( thermonuclease family)
MGKSLVFTPKITMNVMAAVLCAAVALSIPARAGSDVIRGSAVAVDGRIVNMNNKQLVLANITVPEPGAKCLLRGKLRDCGNFARLGLTELVVATTIECRKLTPHTYSCKTEDGYDLALGQIHAGWAVPTQSAPDHYFTKMSEAKAKKRMLWSASHADGKPGYAATLLGKP